MFGIIGGVRYTVLDHHVTRTRDACGYGLPSGQACRCRFLSADRDDLPAKGNLRCAGWPAPRAYPYPFDGARFFAFSGRQRGACLLASRSRIPGPLPHRLGERADRPSLRMAVRRQASIGVRSASTSSCMGSPTSPFSGSGCPRVKSGSALSPATATLASCGVPGASAICGEADGRRT